MMVVLVMMKMMLVEMKDPPLNLRRHISSSFHHSTGAGIDCVVQDVYI